MIRAAAFLISLPLFCQSPSDTELLDRIRVKVKENLTGLPNYTCVETIERSTRLKPNAKFTISDSVRLEVAYVNGRELFGWPGTAKIEEPDITKLVSGAIGNGDFGVLPQAIFFTPLAQIDFIGRTDLEGKPAILYRFTVPQEAKTFSVQTGVKHAMVGFHGSVWVDGVSLDLIRIESVVDDVPRELDMSSGVTVLNFGRSTIGSSIFLLPQNSDLLMTSLNGSAHRNRTTFHGCRQFSGVSVLRFDEPTAEPAKIAQPRAVIAVNLPEEFEVEIKLNAAIDSATAAVGDSVRATIGQNIKLGRNVVVPKGAEISCRIALLQKRFNYYVMTLEASDIDFEGGHADLTGRENMVAMIIQRNGRLSNPGAVFRQVPQVFPMDHLQLPRGSSFILRSRLLKSRDNDSIRPGSRPGAI